MSDRFPIAAVIFTVLLNLNTAPVYAEDTDVSLIDTKESIVLGISVFSGKGLERENEYLTMNIPTLIREKLHQFPYHFLSSLEQTEYRARMRERAIEKRKKEMNTLFTERDKIFLSGNFNDEQKNQFNDKIADLRAQIQNINDLEDGEMIVSEKKPLTIYVNEENAGLLPVFDLTSSRISRRVGLDLYIHGSVEQIADYIFIKLTVWNTILQQDALVIEDAGTRDDLQEIVNRIVEKTYDVIVGEHWAFVEVDVQPEEADIFIDGEFIGTGTVSTLYVEPGDHRINASAAGYENAEKNVTVTQGQTLPVELTLLPRELDSLTVFSEPEGANVYEGSVWLGTTPLVLPLQGDDLQRIMVVKKDYSPEYFNVGPGDSGRSIDVNLSPFSFDSSAYLTQKRDTFYLSAGFLVLSFPIPFFLYSITEDLASGLSLAIQSNNIDEIETKLRTSVNTYHAYVGSLVVVASLLIHTLFRLADYIKASELY